VRVFVAIDVPDDVRRAIGDLIARLGKTCRGARHLRPGSCSGTRWVRPEAMHITLKFIGEVSEEKIAEIRTALGTISVPPPMEIHFRATGFFPNEKHPRVFWAGIEAPPGLAAFAGAIDRALEPLSIPPEQRPFRPHLTLARFKSEDGLPQLRRELERLGRLNFGSTVAREFHLFQSVLKPAGAVYTRLASYRFTDGGA
jgi:RNA 2',3'-cyclic 3'-phosphodiesterase